MGRLQICSSDFLRILDELMQQKLLFNRCYQVLRELGRVFLLRLLRLDIGHREGSSPLLLILLWVFHKF